VLQLPEKPGPNPNADMDNMPLPDPSQAEKMIADLIAQDPEPPVVINRAGSDIRSSRDCLKILQAVYTYVARCCESLESLSHPCHAASDTYPYKHRHQMHAILRIP